MLKPRAISDLQAFIVGGTWGEALCGWEGIILDGGGELLDNSLADGNLEAEY